jgi:ribonuclease HI
MAELNIYCDGGARGNPGPAACSFTVLINGKEIYNESIFLGKTTNNVAEYNAVLMAYKWLANYSDKQIYSKIIFFLDSQLAVKQLNGLYKIKSNNLGFISKKI